MPHVIRRPGRVNGLTLAVFLALVHAVNDTLMALLGALLPTLQTRLAATATTLALLVAAFNVSSSVAQPWLGAFADRVGLRQIAAAGVALVAVSLSLVGVAGSVLALLALLVLGGVGSAALHPVATSIVGAPSAANPGLAVGLFTAGGMAGFAAGPVLILYLVAEYGLGVTPWLMAPGLALAAGLLVLLPDWEPHRRPRTPRVVDRRLFTGPVGRLTAASALISLVFITVTSAVPLWLATARGLAADAPLLGWVLAAFSLGAAAGAVAGGALARRYGYARTTTVSLLAAIVPLTGLLLAPPGALTVAAAGAAGALIYASQPLLIVAAQNAAPHAPAAAAGVVLGIGTAIAGAAYIAVGAAQDAVGLTPAIAATFLLLIPAAAVAGRALRQLT
jgi:FSR family fosmidomycin resistance protein-like MFS transporter